MRPVSLLATVFPEWRGLHLDAVTRAEQQILVEASSARRSARCPDCQRRSRRAHSRFTRVLADLPLGGFPVCVRLHARRFRCLNAACPRQTFRERLPDVAPCYQRRTPALHRRLEAVAFALGGQAGCRLVRRLQLGTVGTSRNTLLRLVRRAVMPRADEADPQVRVLGVDDFAFRRGLRYGAILVDLEQHRVLDLLPNREAATLATWLEQHGGQQVQVVSRDRGGAFADGARQAAPHAVHVADRFHLLHNLRQALDRLLTREHRVLTHVADAVSAGAEPAAERTPEQTAQEAATARCGAGSTPAPAPTPATRVEREHAVVEERRQARYERVVAFASEGYSLREVARRAGVNRGAVRSYLQSGQYRSCATRARRRRGEDSSGRPPPPPRRFSPRQTRWVLLRPVEELDEGERTYRQALCRESVVMATAQELAEDFGRIVRTRATADLDPWLTGATRSRQPELVSFANGIRRDHAAVAAALTSPHSQGQTEGHVNRLKLLKRSRYGRAKFDLLRGRVLYAAR